MAHSLFVVASGRLAIRLATPAGRVIEVVEVGQYGVSGWSSLVAPHVYVAEAKRARGQRRRSRSPPTEGTLRRCDLLGPLSDRQIGELAACATTRALHKGESLFEQNDEAHDFFVVAAVASPSV